MPSEPPSAVLLEWPHAPAGRGGLELRGEHHGEDALRAGTAVSRGQRSRSRWPAARCSAQPPAAATAALPPVKHVFVLVLENESEATSFGAGSPAPYLAKTLSHLRRLPAATTTGSATAASTTTSRWSAVRHRTPRPPPTAARSRTSPAPTSLDASGQETGQGCVYPAAVPTLMSQLQGAGLSWRGYMDGMGANPAARVGDLRAPGGRQSRPHRVRDTHRPVRHPARPVRLLPFGDRQRRRCATQCGEPQPPPGRSGERGHHAELRLHHAEPLQRRPRRDPAPTAAPAACPAADAFLRTWVPRITTSPAFQQNGLLLVTFDESVGDATACCGEKPGPYDAANGIQPGGSGPGRRGGRRGHDLAVHQGRNHDRHAVQPLLHARQRRGPVRAPAAGGRRRHGRRWGSDVFTRPTPAGRPPDQRPEAEAEPPLAPPSRHRDQLHGVRGGHHHADGVARCCPATGARPTPAATPWAPASGGRRTPGPARSSSPSPISATRDTAGVNRVAFSGRVRGHALGKGSYEVVLVPKSGSLIGRSATARFTVS